MSLKKPRPEPPTAIAAEADRLETSLQRALSSDWAPVDVAVIGAAALEVAELAYWLANGWGDHLLWVAVHDG